MKHPTLFLLLLTVIFVGATSCGDDQKAKDAEIAALRQQLALQASGQGRTTVVVNQVTTAVVTSFVQQTQTNVTSSTGTTGGTTVVYTVTSTTGGGTTNTGSSTATGTAPRE